MLDRVASDALRSRSPETLRAAVHELLTDPENRAAF
jgi:hypothetical protein